MTGPATGPVPPLPPGTRLHPQDVLRLGLVGIRTRPLRTVLAALGIAIGIASLVAVLGIPASNRAALRLELAALGPNLLIATPGQLPGGQRAELPKESVAMVGRVAPVQAVSATGDTGTAARRSPALPVDDTGGPVLAARLDLLTTLRGTVAQGAYLTAVTERYPVAVLGAVAATRLGIDLSGPGPAPVIAIGDELFTVAGILDRLTLAPVVDRSVLVGWPAAEEYLGFDGRPNTLFVRVQEHAVEQVRSVLGRTANPADPSAVLVSRPSDALAASRLAEASYAALFVGLGGVALLVGGVGVANTMVVSVLERRPEIGLRRALGATRRQIRGQFLAEAMVLAGLGGLVGTMLGVVVTTAFAAWQGWPAVLPPVVLLGGPAAALLIGAIAGGYPALRASRLTPTEALNAR
ncbi:MAG TPA: ABC transporter permease [Pseudonocardiaceae bacterium]